MRELRWTEWSEEHIAGHAVTPSEVEEVLYSHPRLRKSGRESSVLVYGTTDAGRHLLVVLGEDDIGGTSFVVTARPMTAKEKRQFTRRGM